MDSSRGAAVVGGREGIDGFGRGFDAAERGIGQQHSMTLKKVVDMETAQYMMSQATLYRFVWLSGAAEEDQADLDSSLDMWLARHKAHLSVSHSPTQVDCPARLAEEDGYIL